MVRIQCALYPSSNIVIYGYQLYKIIYHVIILNKKKASYIFTTTTTKKKKKAKEKLNGHDAVPYIEIKISNTFSINNSPLEHLCPQYIA